MIPPAQWIGLEADRLLALILLDTLPDSRQLGRKRCIAHRGGPTAGQHHDIGGRQVNSRPAERFTNQPFYTIAIHGATNSPLGQRQTKPCVFLIIFGRDDDQTVTDMFSPLGKNLSEFWRRMQACFRSE